MKIKGYFKEQKPFIKLHIKGCKRPLDVMIDTGFSGCLALPQGFIKEARLKLIGEGKYLTLKGRPLVIKVYLAYIHWFGKVEEVTILSAKAKYPLIGMGLLYDTILEMQGAKNRVVVRKGK